MNYKKMILEILDKLDESKLKQIWIILRWMV